LLGETLVLTKSRNSTNGEQEGAHSSNLPYVSDDDPRSEETFDVRFPGVQTGRPSHALLARARHGEQIAVARIQDSSTCRSVDLSAGAKIYLLKESGQVTAILTATDRRRPGSRWIQMDDNRSLQNLLIDLFRRPCDWRG
jgi:hypothetical protein